MCDHCRFNPKQHGNTLTEYAIIIGLIGVASVSALMMLGQSMNGQYRHLSQGNSAQAMKAMTQMDFSVPSGVSSAQGQPPVAQSNQQTQPSQYNIGASNFQMADTSSSGTNVTSIEGNFNAVFGQGLQTAQKMEELASSTEDPKLREWYKKTSDMVFKLASSQAAYEVISDPSTAYLSVMIPKGNLRKIDQADAVKSIDAWQDGLQGQLDALQSNKTASAAEIQQAKGLLSAVVETNKARYTPIVQSTDTKKGKLYDPDVKQVKKVAEMALQSGFFEENTSLDTAVTNGLTMDEKGSSR